MIGVVAPGATGAGGVGKGVAGGVAVVESQAIFTPANQPSRGAIYARNCNGAGLHEMRQIKGVNDCASGNRQFQGIGGIGLWIHRHEP
jgi:hypothetical protein